MIEETINVDGIMEQLNRVKDDFLKIKMEIGTQKAAHTNEELMAFHGIVNKSIVGIDKDQQRNGYYYVYEDKPRESNIIVKGGEIYKN